jgi:hypothetical protein
MAIILSQKRLMNPPRLPSAVRCRNRPIDLLAKISDSMKKSRQGVQRTLPASVLFF